MMLWSSISIASAWWEMKLKRMSCQVLLKLQKVSRALLVVDLSSMSCTYMTVAGSASGYSFSRW